MRRVKWVAVLPLLCLAAVGCNRKQGKAPPPKDPEVMVALPLYQEVTDYEDFTGRTAAIDDVTIRATRVSGILTKALDKAMEGRDVKKDTLLFEIDPRPYQAELDRAKASLFKDKAHRDRLSRDYERAVGLRAKGSLSPQEFDQVAGDLAEARASVGVSEAAVATAQLNLDFTKVYAPFDGRLSRRMVDPGNVVKADDTALTTIVRLDPIYIYFDVDERTMLKVRRLVRKGDVKSYRETGGLPVFVGLADEVGYPHQAMINFADNRIDESTGTKRVRAVLSNPRKGTSYLFEPGQFVRIRFPVGTPKWRYLVAERALGTDQGQKYIDVIVKKRNEETGQYEERVDHRQVRYGAVHRGLRVIDEKSVRRDERVVVSGLQRIRKNSKVVVKKVDMVTSKPLPWWDAWNYFDFPTSDGKNNNEKVTKK
jgi:RND family efflux transporter MFP subunit